MRLFAAQPLKLVLRLLGMTSGSWARRSEVHLCTYTLLQDVLYLTNPRALPTVDRWMTGSCFTALTFPIRPHCCGVITPPTGPEPIACLHVTARASWQQIAGLRRRTNNLSAKVNESHYPILKNTNLILHSSNLFSGDRVSVLQN